MLQETCTSF